MVNKKQVELAKAEAYRHLITEGYSIRDSDLHPIDVSSNIISLVNVYVERDQRTAGLVKVYYSGENTSGICFYPNSQENSCLENKIDKKIA